LKVEVLYASPVHLAVQAARKCYASEGLSDSNEAGLGPKDQTLLKRIVESGHHSVIEHAVFTFDVDGISRGCLQEFARHRIASLSVKSTRYTLGRLKSEAPFVSYEDDWDRAATYLVDSRDEWVNTRAVYALEDVRMGAHAGIPNDTLKYCLPESFKTSLIWTINARSLRNFLTLRSAPQAHWEIRQLAAEIVKVVPAAYHVLFHDVISTCNEETVCP